MSAPPPLHPRHRALAAVDALTAKVEETVRSLRLAAERPAVAAAASGRAVALLRLAEERLARLRESRRVLLEGRAEDGGERRKAEARRRRERRTAPPEGTGEP